MKIDITGRNVEITDALEVNIKNKLKRLENHFENIININFILTVEKERMKAEALITIKNGNLFADNENKNMYTAIDEVIIKLDRQLRKQKEKIRVYSFIFENFFNKSYIATLISTTQKEIPYIPVYSMF